MGAFEEKLTALVHEGLRSGQPNAGIVGKFVGAAIAATIAGGREPREVFGVLTDALRILEGPEKGQVTAYATRLSILLEEWLDKDPDHDAVLTAIFGLTVGVMIAADRDPRQLVPMLEDAIQIVLTPGPN